MTFQQLQTPSMTQDPNLKFDQERSIINDLSATPNSVNDPWPQFEGRPRKKKGKIENKKTQKKKERLKEKEKTTLPVLHTGQVMDTRPHNHNMKCIASNSPTNTKSPKLSYASWENSAESESTDFRLYLGVWFILVFIPGACTKRVLLCSRV